MKKRTSIIWLLVLALAFSVFPSFSYAEAGEPDAESSCSDINGEIAYNDDWFSGSSFDYNPHLATLAAILADASDSYIVSSTPMDFSQSSKNIRALLGKLKLEDIETNEWYDREMRMNTLGVIAGHKTVNYGDGEKTLLFVIPRSAGYYEEMGGNFIVGVEGISEGFLEARDETLRFLKSYMKDKGITGEVILFTAGYSRGSAAANSVGGFFAAGGAEGYFDGITVDPEDVYAFCIAAPNCVPETGMTRRQELSVAGDRRSVNPVYAYDSAGDPYYYAGEDAEETVDPKGEEYGGIYCFTSKDDIVPMVPPAAWGFTTYGKNRQMTIEATANFRVKTFNLKSFSFVDDPSAVQLTQGEFVSGRLAALIQLAGSRQNYTEEGYQDILASLMAIVGMNTSALANFSTWMVSPENTIRALLFTYLDYGSNELIKEGRAADDAEAVSIILKEILEWLTKEQLDSTQLTVDHTFYLIAKYLVDDVDATFSGETFAAMPFKLASSISYKSQLSQKVFEGLSKYLISAIPESYKDMVAMLLPGWGDADETKKREMAGTFVYSFLNACVYGYGDSSEPGQEEDAQTVRNALYSLANLLFAEKYPEITAILEDAETKTAKELAGQILNVLKGGESITLGEGADKYLALVLDSAAAGLKGDKIPEGSEGAKEIDKRISALKKDLGKLRGQLLHLLFYDEAEQFSVSSDVRNIATLVGNGPSLLAAHVIGNYVSLLRAEDSAYPVHAHSWGDWEVTKKATTASKGEETRTCQNCGKTETRETPRLKPYSPDDPVIIPEKEDPEKEPEIVPTTKYSNEWVDGKWYDKNGRQPYQGIGSWQKNKKGIWYQDSLNWYPKNRWQKIDGKWYFFDREGYREEDAYRKGYYLTKDGSWDGKPAVTGWKEDEIGWQYILGENQKLTSTWKKIDGKWYYFKDNGYAAQNEFIQGWWLGSNCAWNDQTRYSWHWSSKGWWYGVKGGWFAKNGPYKINDTVRSFGLDGYCMNP